MMQPMAVKRQKSHLLFFWLKGFFYHPGFSGTWGIDLVRVCPTCPWQVVLHFTYIRVIAFFQSYFQKRWSARTFHGRRKNTKNWYTIDALGAIFAIFIILLQYFYNTFTILMQYFYNTFSIRLL